MLQTISYLQIKKTLRFKERLSLIVILSNMYGFSCELGLVEKKTKNNIFFQKILKK